MTIRQALKLLANHISGLLSGVGLMVAIKTENYWFIPIVLVFTVVTLFLGGIIYVAPKK